MLNWYKKKIRRVIMHLYLHYYITYASIPLLLLNFIIFLISGQEFKMGFFHSSPLPKCPSQGCSEWARVYLKYCLCSKKDGVALTLGLLSVVSWGVAEVPQIMTNHKTKSTEGLSLAFLMTWLIG